jgi:hypothetical protein
LLETPSDGVADFDALHSRKYDDEVQLYVFDILALDGCRPKMLADLATRIPDLIIACH